MSEKPIISARNLSVDFLLSGGFLAKSVYLRAIRSVNLDIPRGSFFGLVGESGSGKTTLGRAFLKASPISEGELEFNDGEVEYDLRNIDGGDLKEYRKRAQMIFQDPYAALSPRMTVRDIIAEPLEVMGITKTRAETDARVREIAAKCRLNLEHLRRFPHAFSGGQRQRISIARTLVAYPKFVVADESVAALDVSIQADILNLLKELQTELGLTYFFISHDLSVVAHICDHVAVMYLGQLVETAPTRELFDGPCHLTPRLCSPRFLPLTQMNGASRKNWKGKFPPQETLLQDANFTHDARMLPIFAKARNHGWRMLAANTMLPVTDGKNCSTIQNSTPKLRALFNQKIELGANFLHSIPSIARIPGRLYRTTP